MKYVCGKCLKLKEEKEIIRMPFEERENEYWCEECYKEWSSS